MKTKKLQAGYVRPRSLSNTLHILPTQIHSKPVLKRMIEKQDRTIQALDTYSSTGSSVAHGQQRYGTRVRKYAVGRFGSPGLLTRRCAQAARRRAACRRAARSSCSRLCSPPRTDRALHTWVWFTTRPLLLAQDPYPVPTARPPHPTPHRSTTARSSCSAFHSRSSSTFRIRDVTNMPSHVITRVKVYGYWTSRLQNTERSCSNMSSRLCYFYFQVTSLVQLLLVCKSTTVEFGEY